MPDLRSGMPACPRSILCVHPNGELYGSDRTFLQAVRAFQARWPLAPVTALIPGEGLLAIELRRLGIMVQFDDIFVLRRSNLGALPRRLLALPRRIRHARAVMREHDLVYLNTIVLLDFLLASRSRRKATVIHIHELPTGKAAGAFTKLLAWSRGQVVFISKAVQGGFAISPPRGVIVWNGTRPIVGDPPDDDPNTSLNVLLIGRFNAWKGQLTLIEALARLPTERRRMMKVRLVGSVYEGQEHFAQSIGTAIQAQGLSDIITIEPFTPMPDRHYRWAHLVVVPSTKPEPFGLVAIEAMAAARPVIASDHGGLSEIVLDGETGMLVPPNDVSKLASALCRYMDDRALLVRHGNAGRQRYVSEFDELIYMRRLADVAAETLAQAC